MDGVINKAKLAEEEYNQVQQDEKAKLEQFTNLLDRYGKNGHLNQKIVAERISFTPEDSNWKVENVKEALDYLYKH